MLCYKRQRKYIVCNELPGSTDRWVIVRDTVSLGVRIPEVFVVFVFVLFFQGSFLRFFFRARLRIRVRVRF